MTHWDPIFDERREAMSDYLPRRDNVNEAKRENVNQPVPLNEENDWPETEHGVENNVQGNEGPFHHDEGLRVPTIDNFDLNETGRSPYLADVT